MYSGKLLTDIVQFNWLPIGYVHASWLEGLLTEEQLGAIKRHISSSKTLNQYLLETEVGADDIPMSAFSDPVLQALISAPLAAQQMADLIGLAIHRESIKRSISASDQRELMSAFGQSGYYFALKRAEFFVDASTAPMISSGGGVKGVVNAVRESGLTMLAMATADLPVAATRRLQYCFPKESGELFSRCWAGHHHVSTENGGEGEQSACAAAARLFIKIMREFNAEWEPVSL